MLSITATDFTIEGLYFNSTDEITINFAPSGSCILANLTQQNGHEVLTLTNCSDLSEGPLIITVERFGGKSEPTAAYEVVPGIFLTFIHSLCLALRINPLFPHCNVAATITDQETSYRAQREPQIVTIEGTFDSAFVDEIEIILEAVDETTNQTASIPLTFNRDSQSTSSNKIVGTVQLNYVGYLKARVFEHLGWSEWVQIGNIYSRKFLFLFSLN